MVEKRMRLRPDRPRTPEGLTLAERIMWKRQQVKETQSQRQKPLERHYSEQVRWPQVGLGKSPEQSVYLCHTDSCFNFLQRTVCLAWSKDSKRQGTFSVIWQTATVFLLLWWCACLYLSSRVVKASCRVLKRLIFEMCKTCCVEWNTCSCQNTRDSRYTVLVLFEQRGVGRARNIPPPTYISTGRPGDSQNRHSSPRTDTRHGYTLHDIARSIPAFVVTTEFHCSETAFLSVLLMGVWAVAFWFPVPEISGSPFVFCFFNRWV